MAKKLSVTEEVVELCREEKGEEGFAVVSRQLRMPEQAVDAEFGKRLARGLKDLAKDTSYVENEYGEIRLNKESYRSGLRAEVFVDAQASRKLSPTEEKELAEDEKLFEDKSRAKQLRAAKKDVYRILGEFPELRAEIHAEMP